MATIYVELLRERRATTLSPSIPGKGRLIEQISVRYGKDDVVLETLLHRVRQRSDISAITLVTPGPAQDGRLILPTYHGPCVLDLEGLREHTSLPVNVITRIEAYAAVARKRTDCTAGDRFGVVQWGHNIPDQDSTATISLQVHTVAGHDQWPCDVTAYGADHAEDLRAYAVHPTPAVRQQQREGLLRLLDTLAVRKQWTALGLFAEIGRSGSTAQHYTELVGPGGALHLALTTKERPEYLAPASSLRAEMAARDQPVRLYLSPGQDALKGAKLINGEPG